MPIDDGRLSPRALLQVLVATNGIAAVKCILSMRKLLMQVFQQDRIIKFVCMTTEQEVQSKAGKWRDNRRRPPRRCSTGAAASEYLKMADHVVFSRSGANTNNYANVDEIVEHAVSERVDAVWAGWGHASRTALAFFVSGKQPIVRHCRRKSATAASTRSQKHCVHRTAGARDVRTW